MRISIASVCVCVCVCVRVCVCYCARARARLGYICLARSIVAGVKVSLSLSLSRVRRPYDWATCMPSYQSWWFHWIFKVDNLTWLIDFINFFIFCIVYSHCIPMRLRHVSTLTNFFQHRHISFPEELTAPNHAHFLPSSNLSGIYIISLAIFANLSSCWQTFFFQQILSSICWWRHIYCTRKHKHTPRHCRPCRLWLCRQKKEVCRVIFIQTKNVYRAHRAYTHTHSHTHTHTHTHTHSYIETSQLDLK